eukprot:TRINITY_DN3574_c0_g7_i1.p1 TRINITY_DN3574_c0_g7~~TRINITY_DN3574_c0_g7_i1.p1  ORF type:complete len:1191 (+),score=195.71 TRINITY_DN3574_c0_g7_i1:106-3678(+)
MRRAALLAAAAWGARGTCPCTEAGQRCWNSADIGTQSDWWCLKIETSPWSNDAEVVFSVGHGKAARDHVDECDTCIMEHVRRDGEDVLTQSSPEFERTVVGMTTEEWCEYMCLATTSCLGWQWKEDGTYAGPSYGATFGTCFLSASALTSNTFPNNDVRGGFKRAAGGADTCGTTACPAATQRCEDRNTAQAGTWECICTVAWGADVLGSVSNCVKGRPPLITPPRVELRSNAINTDGAVLTFELHAPDLIDPALRGRVISHAVVGPGAPHPSEDVLAYVRSAMTPAEAPAGFVATNAAELDFVKFVASADGTQLTVTVHSEDYRIIEPLVETVEFTFRPGLFVNGDHGGCRAGTTPPQCVYSYDVEAEVPHALGEVAGKIDVASVLLGVVSLRAPVGTAGISTGLLAISLHSIYCPTKRGDQALPGALNYFHGHFGNEPDTVWTGAAVSALTLYGVLLVAVGGAALVMYVYLFIRAEDAAERERHERMVLGQARVGGNLMTSLHKDDDEPQPPPWAFVFMRARAGHLVGPATFLFAGGAAGAASCVGYGSPPFKGLGAAVYIVFLLPYAAYARRQCATMHRHCELAVLPPQLSGSVRARLFGRATWRPMHDSDPRTAARHAIYHMLNRAFYGTLRPGWAMLYFAQLVLSAGMGTALVYTPATRVGCRSRAAGLAVCLAGYFIMMLIARPFMAWFSNWGEVLTSAGLVAVQVLVVFALNDPVPLDSAAAGLAASVAEVTLGVLFFRQVIDVVLYAMQEYRAYKKAGTSPAKDAGRAVQFALCCGEPVGAWQQYCDLMNMITMRDGVAFGDGNVDFSLSEPPTASPQSAVAAAPTAGKEDDALIFDFPDDPDEDACTTTTTYASGALALRDKPSQSTTIFTNGDENTSGITITPVRTMREEGDSLHSTLRTAPSVRSIGKRASASRSSNPLRNRSCIDPPPDTATPPPLAVKAEVSPFKSPTSIVASTPGLAALRNDSVVVARRVFSGMRRNDSRVVDRLRANGAAEASGTEHTSPETPALRFPPSTAQHRLRKVPTQNHGLSVVSKGWASPPASPTRKQPMSARREGPTSLVQFTRPPNRRASVPKLPQEFRLPPRQSPTAAELDQSSPFFGTPTPPPDAATTATPDPSTPPPLSRESPAVSSPGTTAIAISAAPLRTEWRRTGAGKNKHDPQNDARKRGVSEVCTNDSV